MTSIVKSLIARTRKPPAPEEIEAMRRANIALQLRAAKITLATPKPVDRTAA